VRTRKWTVAVILGLAQGFSSGGGGESARIAPIGPSPAPSLPAGIQPRISTINTTAVTTLGDGFGIISGAGFEGTARVWLGSDAPRQIWVKDAQTIDFWTNAHEAGTVDVTVRNSGGREDTLPHGFAFAPPESFDFNGVWIAHAGDEYETDMRFIIENNRLTSLTCGSSLTVQFVPSPAVSQGAFSGEGEGGLRVSGRIVSDSNAVGEINVVPCAALWWADKSTAAAVAR
jgi:hypothetical protein